MKAGIRYGSTDETGMKAVQDKVHLHGLHATMLHLLGLDHERLTDVFGEVTRGLLA